MPKQSTEDHGIILHFAGKHHLFPVANKANRAEVRLSTHDDVKAEEVRVGWDGYFRPFLDRGLVFVYDDAGGQAMTRAEAEAAVKA
ncbi:MAG: hypothetical protein JST92_00910 [Deltaproteobacteria bacterium]|nr:hypothetical protein [Deltaproteobacteria bacterium]